MSRVRLYNYSWTARQRPTQKPHQTEKGAKKAQKNANMTEQ